MTSGAGRALALPILAAIVAMSAYQLGGALAKQLFPSIGPEGAATLRLAFGALMLLAIMRPWRAWPHGAPLLPTFGLGVSMAAVVLMFFQAIDRLPLGVAISLQFLGPLSIAVFGSRRARDLAWAALAGLGVWLLTRTGVEMAALDPQGVAWALGSAAGWASYILFGRAASAALGPATAAVATSIAAALMLPVGFAHAGAALLEPAILPIALALALLAAVIPFSLELYAMPRMPARTFAVLMSLEPAIGVACGLSILGERLAPGQIAGVAAVMAAAAGSTWAGAPKVSADPADAPPA